MKREPDLQETYEHLLTLWTSGVRDYQSALRLLDRQFYLCDSDRPHGLAGFARATLPILILVLSIFGVLLCIQMAIVLGPSTLGDHTIVSASGGWMMRL